MLENIKHPPSTGNRNITIYTLYNKSPAPVCNSWSAFYNAQHIKSQRQTNIINNKLKHALRLIYNTCYHRCVPSTTLYNCNCYATSVDIFRRQDIILMTKTQLSVAICSLKGKATQSVITFGMLLHYNLFMLQTNP